MEIKCRFRSYRGYYECIVNDVVITGPGQEIKEVKGDHDAGKSNEDVTDFICEQLQMKHFPRGLSNHFPNLINLFVIASGINEISKHDLEGLEKLKEFYMDGCSLTSLPDELFHNMPNLEDISFAGNQIELTSSNFLKPFVGKSKFFVDLRENKNIDAWYDSAKLAGFEPDQKLSLEELMRTIDENCIKPQKSQQLSSPKSRNFIENEKVKDLWITGRFSDMKIISGGIEFKVHRTILAIRSPVLAGIIEQDKEEMKINGFSPDAVKSMLHFIYTNEILLENNAIENFTIAHKFKMQGMKSAYEEIFSSKLNDSNAYETFLLAHQNQAKDLKQKAINLIAKKLAPLPMSFAEDPIKLKKLIDIRSEYDKLLEEQ